MWTKLIDSNIDLEVLTQVYPNKGNLVYEYNPFRNYRLSKDMYLYKDNYYSLKELEDNFGITLNGNTW
jgi:hypothetical protein